MQRVFVVDTDKKPLSPCAPARARMLLRKGKAAVYRREPFTIILKYGIEEPVPPVELRIDSGSRTTGIALVGKCKKGDQVVWACELEHRGLAVRDALTSRRAIRRGRRNRHTRYRQPRFNNRTRPAGWLPPSLMSRVNNVVTWSGKILALAPVASIAVETVRFDTQALQNPEISGVEYQRGTLFGYEVREYLLEKWGRKCAYCGVENVKLSIDHIIPKEPIRGPHGTDRISNLTIACIPCNKDKNNKPVEEFLAGKPEILRKILAQAKKPLIDAAAINATRYAIGNALKSLNVPVSFWSGGRTKFNRVRQDYPKAHWIDAACVGEAGGTVFLKPDMQVLKVKACGHGSRQMCRMDRYGFPRTKAKGLRLVNGFRTGDIVKAVVPTGKKAGEYSGRIAVRRSGSFNIATASGTVQGVNHRHCVILHRSDGYNYSIIKRQEETVLLPMAKARGIRAANLG